MVNLAAHIFTFGGLLVLGMLAAVKSDASQSEIPFVVTNQQVTNQCVRCVGPRFRDTGSQKVRPLVSKQELFSARVTELSPFGGWTCQVMKFDADVGQCTSEPVNATDFCLRKDSRSASVALNIKGDGTLGTNQPQNCTTDSASVAFLGNHRPIGKPDRDTYLFMANAGNEVIAILEPEANSRNFGKSAVLGLRHKDRTTGAKFKKIVRGALPLRIEATVPETGTYEIFVAQPHRRRAPFRGFYHLSTRGNILAPRLTVDQDAIEPVVAGEPLSPLPSDAGCYRATIQSAELDGALKVSNRTKFLFQIKILQNGGVLANTKIRSKSNFIFRDQSDADEVQLDLALNPFSIELEARENGTFAGSTRLQLANIRNRLVDIVRNGSCS